MGPDHMCDNVVNENEESVDNTEDEDDDTDRILQQLNEGKS